MIKIRCAPSHRDTVIYYLERIGPPNWYGMQWYKSHTEGDIEGVGYYFKQISEGYSQERRAFENILMTCDLRALRLIRNMELVQP